MANNAIANTFTTYDMRGGREDLNDIITNISPKDTPFMSNGGKGQMTQTFKEWQTDVLATASTSNAAFDGGDITTFDSVTATVRVGNYSQIFTKSVIISGTEEIVDKAGRKSETAYQLVKKSAELKRDIEATLTTNQGASAGSAGGPTPLARNLGALPAWLKTNTQKGSGGTDPTYTNIPSAARGDGTQAAFTETMLKANVLQVYNSGGKPDMLMVGPFNKQTASGFSGVATKTFYQSAVEETAIIGAADVYVSDFGTFSIVPNRFQRARDAFLLNPEFYYVDFLRPFLTEPLAKTGDAEKRLILAELTLRVSNEQALGGIYDLTTS